MVFLYVIDLFLTCNISFVGIMVNDPGARGPSPQMFARKVCVFISTCLKKRKNQKKIGRRDSSRQENLGHDSDPLMNPHHLLSETLQSSPPLPQPPYSITSPPPRHPSPLLSVCAPLIQWQVKFPDLTLIKIALLH